jgi:hypothetical protein
MPEVQKELKLQQAQVDLLQAMNEERRNKGREAFQQFQNLTPEQRQQRFAAMQQDEEKQVAQILDPPQMARLKQLQLQQAGMRALDRKDVADTLKLSPAQRQAVQAALQSERDTMQKTFEALRNGQTDGQPPTDEQRQAFQQAFQQMRTLRTSTDAKLAAVLTDAQKKQLQQMQGAPFQFPQPRFGGFGGPGGPGGPRPGGK